MIIQQKNTRFYANFNKNKNSFGGTVQTSSTTYADSIIGGAVDISNVSMSVLPTSIIDDLSTNKNLTIFFRFILTTFNTTAISAPNSTRPVLLSYNKFGNAGAFYIQVLETGAAAIVFNSTAHVIAQAGDIQLNTEYSIALTYSNSGANVYLNAIKKVTAASAIISPQAVGLSFDYSGEFYSKGYQVGDFIIANYQDENAIKRIHYGLHSLK